METREVENDTGAAAPAILTPHEHAASALTRTASCSTAPKYPNDTIHCNLQPGTPVTLRGLAKRTDLNGLSATVRELVDLPIGYQVEVSTGEVVTCMAANVVTDDISSPAGPPPLPKQQPKAAVPLPVGASVVLQGLCNRTDLNGLSAVVRHQSGNLYEMEVITGEIVTCSADLLAGCAMPAVDESSARSSTHALPAAVKSDQISAPGSPSAEFNLQNDFPANKQVLCLLLRMLHPRHL